MFYEHVTTSILKFPDVTQFIRKLDTYELLKEDSVPGTIHRSFLSLFLLLRTMVGGGAGGGAKQ
jgi:hypothetical protein